MSTLFEKIAAKKAAALLAEQEMAPLQEVKKMEEAPKEEGKPLSFAEKMALKKMQATASTSTENIATAAIVKNTETTTTMQLSSASLEKAQIPAEVVVAIVASVAEEEDHTAEVESASPEDQQAYYDIKAKINLLSDMSEANLPGAMKELKTALLKNPQACYLILPQDIGQMVIALRAMKNEAIVDATKTPKEKKAKASKALTADEIAQAFDEL
jgi:hypothetical protein